MSDIKEAFIKKIKEKRTLNTKNVPVYDRKGNIVDHVYKSTTSVGASKILKTRTAEYSNKHGKMGWIGKD
jgi:hypothetical protein